MVALALTALVAWDLRLAGRLAAEDHVIEWIQAALLGGAAALSGRRALSLVGDSRPAAPDVLLTFLFATMVIQELSMGYRLLGIHIVLPRFFVNPAVWFPCRILAALVIGGVPLGVAAYAFRHRGHVWRAARGLMGEPWGHLFLAGVAVFGFAQLFERRMKTLLPLPRNFMEESLEMVAALYFFLGMIERTFFCREPSD